MWWGMCGLRRRAFKGDRPPWRAGEGAECILLRDRVDLKDGAVDFDGKFAAEGLKLFVKCNRCVDAAANCDFGADYESPLTEQFEGF